MCTTVIILNGLGQPFIWTNLFIIFTEKLENLNWLNSKHNQTATLRVGWSGLYWFHGYIQLPPKSWILSEQQNKTVCLQLILFVIKLTKYGRMRWKVTTRFSVSLISKVIKINQICLADTWNWLRFIKLPGGYWFYHRLKSMIIPKGVSK